MYEIQKYVLRVMKEKGIRKSRFVKSIGYRNIAKGCRKFDQFMDNDIYLQEIAGKLHIGLDVSKNEIKKPWELTSLEIEKEIEEIRKKEREEFIPFLFYRTERRIPQPIFVCAILGADRMRYINLPDNFNDKSIEEQNAICKSFIVKKLQKDEGSIPTFGRIIHFVLKNYYEDDIQSRVVYDLNGERVLNSAGIDKNIYKGNATLTVKGQDITRFFK